VGEGGWGDGGMGRWEMGDGGWGDGDGEGNGIVELKTNFSSLVLLTWCIIS